MVNIRHVFNFSSLFYGLIEYSYRYFSCLLIVLSAFHFWPCNNILLRKNENLAKSARSLYLFSCQGALSIRVEKPVVPVGNQMEWAFPLEIFRKIGIPSEVFLFSRFSQNDRKISVPFATTSLFAQRARSTSDPKNADWEMYPLN